MHLAFADAGRPWTKTSIGGAGARGSGTFAAGPRSFTHSGGRFTVTGSGDIAPDQPEAPQGAGIEAQAALQFGLLVGLIPVIIVAALFMTAEYRRGLIRLTFAASPRRGRVLAAKAVLIGLVTFVAGLAGAGDRGTGLAAAGDASRRRRGDPGHPRLPPGARADLAAGRLLSAVVVGRARGAVRVGGGRAGRCGVCAAQEGRMSGVSAGRAPGVLAAALHAEWTKVRTLPGTFWLLAATAVLTVGAGAAAGAAFHCSSAACSPAATGADPARISLTGVDLGQVLAAVLAVLAVGGEYSNGMIRVTLTAVPRRAVVLLSKAAVVAGLTLAASLAGVLGSVLAGRLLLPSRGMTAAHGYMVLSLSNITDLRAAFGSVLYLTLVAMLALGITAAELAWGSRWGPGPVLSWLSSPRARQPRPDD